MALIQNSFKTGLQKPVMTTALSSFGQPRNVEKSTLFKKFRELLAGSSSQLVQGVSTQCWLSLCCDASTSFIVAKSFKPLRYECKPGVVLLLPSSLVRPGALRNIFILNFSNAKVDA